MRGELAEELRWALHGSQSFEHRSADGTAHAFRVHGATHDVYGVKQPPHHAGAAMTELYLRAQATAVMTVSRKTRAGVRA